MASAGQEAADQLPVFGHIVDRKNHARGLGDSQHMWITLTARDRLSALDG